MKPLRIIFFLASITAFLGNIYNVFHLILGLDGHAFPFFMAKPPVSFVLGAAFMIVLLAALLDGLIAELRGKKRASNVIFLLLFATFYLVVYYIKERRFLSGEPFGR